MEHRQGLEFRVIGGNTLTGIVLRYGDISSDFRERFTPGAFAPIPSVPMRLQHDESVELLAAGTPGYVLIDSPSALEIRAELPRDAAALQLVRRGALSGWSVGFRSITETRLAGIRVIERAELVEVSLVDAGSYPLSRAEVRAELPGKRRLWL